MTKTYKAEVFVTIETESETGECPLYPYSQEDLATHLQELVSLDLDYESVGNLSSRDNTKSQVVAVEINWDTLKLVGIARATRLYF
ncbi:MAG: hypothetical protein WC390_10380 [Sulfurimonas sp.]|jgi:hypothetical protein